MKSIVAVLAGLFLGLASGGVARADWLKAESDHFIVYSDGGERALRDYVQRLEVFDSVLRVFVRVDEERPRRKLPIYLVGGLTDLRKVYHAADTEIGGVYVPTGEDIFAVAMRRGAQIAEEQDDILLHEYAHHYLMGNFDASYPGWFIEGFAEYFASTKIGDGSVDVGRFATGRAYWLVNGSWMSMEDLLRQRPQEALATRQGRETYYPLSLLLTHWFQATPERLAQLDRYLSDVRRGADPVEALRTATELTPAQLERALRQYMRSRVPYKRLTFDIPQAEIAVTRLSASADDLLLLSQKLKMGVPNADRADVAAQVRRLAARHPTDPFAQLTLAHAELHFGDRETGRDLLSRFLEGEPANVEALQYLAADLISQADEAEDDAASVALRRRAQQALATAYAADPRHYYTFYLMGQNREGLAGYPNDNDLQIWTNAFDHAPQWPGARLGLAAALMSLERHDEAVALLEVLANAPHGGEASVAARHMIQLAQAGEAPLDADVLEAAADDPAPPAEPPAPPAGSEEGAVSAPTA